VDRLAVEHPHPALVEQAVEQPLARHGGIDEFVVLMQFLPQSPDRARQADLPPGDIPEGHARLGEGGVTPACRPRPARPPRGGPGSGSARTGGNTGAPPPRNRARQADLPPGDIPEGHARLGEGGVPEDDAWVEAPITRSREQRQASWTGWPSNTRTPRSWNRR
jgi:hypothetical protein